MATSIQVPTPGGVLLVDERKPELSYKLLEEYANGRRQLLCITREPPERVARRHPMENVAHYWLITGGGTQTVNPFHLEALRELIRGFVREHPESAVLIDGVELLMVMNTYEQVRDFLANLQGTLKEDHAECIIPIDTRTLTKREFAELKTAFSMMRGSATG